MRNSLLVVRFVAVGMSVLHGLKFRGSVGCNCPDCVQDGTQTRTDSHTHKTPSVAVTKGMYFEPRLLLHHDCHNAQSLEDGVLNTQKQTA